MLTGQYPFDDPNVYKLLRRVRAGSFVVPDVDGRVKDLLSRMLTVDPAVRITIPEIKEHEGFWLDAPRVSWTIPPPLSIPDEPVDIRSVDSEFIGILKMLGYESQSTIEAELAAQGPTNAKRVKQMMDVAMTRRKSRPGILVAG
jgi:serine/threonine protein kinase